jgi:hypothetical protein
MRPQEKLELSHIQQRNAMLVGQKRNGIKSGNVLGDKDKNVDWQDIEKSKKKWFQGTFVLRIRKLAALRNVSWACFVPKWKKSLCLLRLGWGNLRIPLAASGFCRQKSLQTLLGTKVPFSTIHYLMGGCIHQLLTSSDDGVDGAFSWSDSSSEEGIGGKEHTAPSFNFGEKNFTSSVELVVMIILFAEHS